MELPVNHFKHALKAGEADGQRCLDMGYLFVAEGSDIGLLRAGDALAAKFKK